MANLLRKQVARLLRACEGGAPMLQEVVPDLAPLHITLQHFQAECSQISFFFFNLHFIQRHEFERVSEACQAALQDLDEVERASKALTALGAGPHWEAQQRLQDIRNRLRTNQLEFVRLRGILDAQNATRSEYDELQRLLQRILHLGGFNAQHDTPASQESGQGSLTYQRPTVEDVSDEEDSPLPMAPELTSALPSEVNNPEQAETSREPPITNTAPSQRPPNVQSGAWDAQPSLYAPQTSIPDPFAYLDNDSATPPTSDSDEDSDETYDEDDEYEEDHAATTPRRPLFHHSNEPPTHSPSHPAARPREHLESTGRTNHVHWHDTPAPLDAAASNRESMRVNIAGSFAEDSPRPSIAHHIPLRGGGGSGGDEAETDNAYEEGLHSTLQSPNPFESHRSQQKYPHNRNQAPWPGYLPPQPYMFPHPPPPHHHQANVAYPYPAMWPPAPGPGPYSPGMMAPLASPRMGRPHPTAGGPFWPANGVAGAGGPYMPPHMPYPGYFDPRAAPAGSGRGGGSPRSNAPSSAAPPGMPPMTFFPPWPFYHAGGPGGAGGYPGHAHRSLHPHLYPYLYPYPYPHANAPHVPHAPMPLASPRGAQRAGGRGRNTHRQAATTPFPARERQPMPPRGGGRGPVDEGLRRSIEALSLGNNRAGFFVGPGGDVHLSTQSSV